MSGDSESQKGETNPPNAGEIKFKMVQNIIKNKFSKAYENRLEHENEVKHIMKPFAEGQTLSTAENYSILTGKNNEIHYDPNDLCEKLKTLINSQFEGHEHQTHEISSIIAKLREMGTIL